MHELPVIKSIIGIVEKHAHENNVKKLIAVHLRVGELSDLEDKWMQKYFDHLAGNGIASGAVLKIERTPVVMQCDECDMKYVVQIKKDEDLNCPACSSRKYHMISGREYVIQNLEAI